MKPLIGTESRFRIRGRVEWLFGLHDPADVAERNGRLAGGAFLLLAIYSAIISPVVTHPARPGFAFAVVALLAASAAVCFVLPWRSLPYWADEVAAAWAVLVLTIGAGAVSGALAAHAVSFAVIFALVGLTGMLLPTARLVLLAEAGLLFATLVGAQEGSELVLAATIVVAAAIGLFVALLVSWNRSSDLAVGTLQAALADLRTAPTETAAANIVASTTAELLGADDAMVLLTEHPGAPVLTNRDSAEDHRPAHSVRIDTTAEQSGAVVTVRTGQQLFVEDAKRSPVLSARLVGQLDIASALFLPIPGEGGVMGTVVAWWHTRRRSVDPFAQRLLELLPTPAGQVLQALRHKGQPDTESMKDPLTGIGNRRRFDAGLTELPVGGAVLLFDLDNFKNINGLHGVDAGDETLRAFATALRRSVRDEDIVTRFSGDKFGVILPHISSPIAGGVIIERLQRIWRSPHGCAFSVGIAIRAAEESPAKTVARADTDLQATKRLKLG